MNFNIDLLQVVQDSNRDISQRRAAFKLIKSMLEDINPNKKSQYVRANGYLLTNEEIRAGRENGKISCIRLVKERLNLSLIDAKNLVELFFETNGLRFSRYTP